MDDRQLKRLKRVELLELLVEQAAEMEELREKLRLAEEALKKRELKLQSAGTMAEAAMRLNEVFESTDRAAKDYLDGIRAVYELREAIMEETRRRCHAMEEEAKAQCAKVRGPAKPSKEGKA